MKKLLLLFLFYSAIPSCNSSSSNLPDESAIIKNSHFREYSTKDVGGKIEKDTLQKDFITGEEKGRSYFLGLTGYSNSDTAWSSEIKTKKSGNKTFSYKKDGSVETVQIMKGDTTFLYSGIDLEEPLTFSISDEKGIIADFDRLLGRKREYVNRVFDKQGNPVYYIIEESFYPSKVHKLMYSDGELLKNEAEMLNTKIVEIKYEYQ